MTEARLPGASRRKPGARLRRPLLAAGGVVAVALVRMPPVTLGAALPQETVPTRGGSAGEERRVAATDLSVPVLRPLRQSSGSALRGVVERYTADRSALLRRWDVEYSTSRRARLRSFYQGWRDRLAALDYEGLGLEGRVDYTLLDNELLYRLSLLEREERLAREMEPLIPFAEPLRELDEARRRMEPVDPPAVARMLAGLPDAIQDTREGIEASLDTAPPSRIVAFRASGVLERLRERMGRWYRNYAGYDPLFTWWNAEPYAEADSALQAYGRFLRGKVVGIPPGGEEPIVGDPIGAEGLRADLIHEMIPYSARELIAIAEREFAWTEAELRKAARAMGFGDDWKAALEKVKEDHLAPGEQPELVRELAHEAVEFVRDRDLVTVPPLAEEIWRIEMMSPEMQRVAPFFLGGEVIRVAFPTDEMTNPDKLMSLRGNNVHFARATVFHELIPGHHLQGFMTSRYNPHRRAFSTPFWGEGWALYWEMLLWDLDFPRTPEDKIGMLFWRRHRAARIIFSLSFHLGRMTPEEAIDLLVEQVGHERANATAEVRRSFNGSYSPLYQAAYMIGGLQIRALHERLVGSGQMTDREFHDAILQGGSMPIEMVRARLTAEAPARSFRASWRFAGDPLGG
ncbi:MAG: DUF885 family protein [Gemmatimonadota bacterium]